MNEEKIPHSGSRPDTPEETPVTISCLPNSLEEQICVVDLNTYEILYASKAIIDMYGKELTGDICYKTLQGLDSPCNFCKIKKLLKLRGRPNIWEYHNPVLKKDFIVSDSIIKWTNSRDVRFGYNMDVTRLKNAEKALIDSENRYRTIFENTGTAIMIVDEDTTISLVNTEFERLSGYSKEELEGKKKWTIFSSEHSLDKMLMYHYNRRYSPDKAPSKYEALCVDREGNVKDILITAAMLPGTSKSVLSLLDITKRKQAEERFRESQLLIQRIADATPYILYVYDLAEQRIVYINRQVTSTLGYTREEAEKASSLKDVLSRADFADFMKKTVSLIENAVDGKVIKFEYPFKHANGEQRWLYNRAVFYKSVDGLTKQILGSAQDVTTHKLTEQQIRDYQEQLRSLASELTLTEERERRRIATELHDHIGQSLAVAKIKLGDLRVILKNTGKENQVEEIRELIEQNIVYTRSLTFELSPAILYELGLEAALEWLCEQIQNQNHVAVKFKDDRQPKPLGDELCILLYRVVRELLYNVAKHAHANCAVVAMQRDGNMVRITVQDDGIGFDPTGLSQTQGFGLFSIREQIKHLGGHLRLVSSPGHGSKFTLVAPLKSQTSNEECT